MTKLSQRRFRLATVALSLLAAVVVTRNFDDFYWTNLILAASSFAGAAIGLRWIWDRTDPGRRSYVACFALFFAFWLVVWFWSADDFRSDYPLTVMVCALTCAVLCTPLRWSRLWIPAVLPYTACYMLGLATGSAYFWLFESRAFHEFGYGSYGVIPWTTAVAAGAFALVWRLVLRVPFLWLVRRRAARAVSPRAEPLPRIIVRCPQGHQVRIPAGRSGRVRCPLCDSLGRSDAVFEVSTKF